MSRQPEHYLLKSQATRPSDVLHREESDNTGRRVLSLSPVGASLFNARWLPSSAKTLFTLVKVPSPEQLCCSEPWNESLNVLLSMLCVNVQKYWIITHAKELYTLNNGKYLFAYKSILLILLLQLIVHFIIAAFMLVCIYEYESAKIYINHTNGSFIAQLLLLVLSIQLYLYLYDSHQFFPLDLCY